MRTKRFLKNSYKDLGIFIFRVSIGSILLFGHGFGKLLSFQDRFHSFADPIGLGSEASYILTVFAEAFCAFAVAIGFYTRMLVIPLIILFLVIIFVVHGDDPWGKKEMAIIFLMSFSAIFFTGPGKYSVDNLILK